MFKVGDVIQGKDWRSNRVYVVLAVHSAGEYDVRVIKSGSYPADTVLSGRSIGEQLFEVIGRCSPSAVVVSSLDYMNNTELSDEDKEIINEHIQSR